MFKWMCVLCNFQWFLFSIISVTVLYLGGGRFFRNTLHWRKSSDSSQVRIKLRSRSFSKDSRPLGKVMSYSVAGSESLIVSAFVRMSWRIWLTLFCPTSAHAVAKPQRLPEALFSIVSFCYSLVRLLLICSYEILHKRWFRNSMDKSIISASVAQPMALYKLQICLWYEICLWYRYSLRPVCYH